ncbi:MAG: 2Fe-2S iron-sulfur cluster-binding protein [Gallionella sp.]|nr:2Fe-2S iron-sulfur cluster-binding protein [Gallionella sp.]
MASSITLQPGNHSFPVEDGETILDAALKHGYTMPFSCRDGVCGVCKGRVLQGSVFHGRFMDSVLSEAERTAGMALFCCASPKSDLVVEYRPVSSPFSNFNNRPMWGMSVNAGIPESGDAPESMDAPANTMP